MKIAVITPYYKESTDVLKQCHQSVVAKKADVDHFMVADGFPNAEVDQWNVRHVKLPNAHGDNGNTPRAMGGLLAQSGGYDFVAYLDADNWFHANHLDSLIDLYKKTGVSILSSFRTFHTAEGVDMGITEAQETRLEHVDTSCLMLHRDAFELLGLWVNMDKSLGPICDRIFFAAIQHRRFQVVSTKLKSVAFRSQYAYHYKLAKMDIPKGMKTGDEFKNSFDYLKSVAGIQACVKNLGFWPLPYLAKKVTPT
jgi:glycosyltransferase involved in cell wall biosynthesis